ncbi:10129_t:CDS:1, partial [Paraglomus brasilianum]
MPPRFKTSFLTTVILVIILCQLVLGLPVSEKNISDEPSTETQLVFEMPTEQNSTNLTVNGQFYNGLSDETLDGIQKRFDEILAWIKDKLNTASDKLKELYKMTAEFVSDHSPLIIMIIITVPVLYCFRYVFLNIIRKIGYSAKGIVRKSPAAFHMSLHGGKVAAGSLVSRLQKVGALGF